MSTEAEPTVLYSTFAQNEDLKKDAEKAGVPVAFNRELGGYVVKADQMSADDLERAKEALAKYLSPEAKEAAELERANFLAERDARREGARREIERRDPEAAKAAQVTAEPIKVYPALSQSKEYGELVRETGSRSSYVRATKQVEAHFSLRTNSPEKFAAFQGPEAQKRFKEEYEASRSENSKVVERMREAAKQRGQEFYSANSRSGFMLAQIPSGLEGLNSPGQKALEAMRASTDGQIKAILAVTARQINELRNKEMQMRAEAAGLPIEQLRKLSFADQKAVARTADGKPIGLVGDDFVRLQALERGRKAMSSELEARGVASPKPEREATMQHDREGQQPAAKPTPEPSKADVAKQTEAPAPAKSEKTEQQNAASVDDELAAVAAAMSRRSRGAGR